MADIAGNTLETAFDLEFLSDVSKILTDEIGGGDFTDYYRFELAENSLVSLLLSDLNQDATLFLRNSDGSREIARSANTSTVDERIELNLKPDVYFLYVSHTASGKATPYTLTAQATSLGPTPVDNAGEILDKANDLGILDSNGIIVNDFIGNFNNLVQDSSDYYRFEIAENSTLNLNLSGLSGNASLSLFNSDFSRAVARSTSTGNVNEVISLNLKAGVYYAIVDGGSNISTTYQLEASAISLGPVPVDAVGDTLQTAKDLGVLTADGVTASDFIGNFNGLDQDSSDYYRFELAENSTLNLKLSGLSGDASLILYNSDQSRVVASSSNVGNADEIISLNLKVGTYYAYVSSGSNVSTTYQLEASAISLGPVPVDAVGDTLQTATDLGVLTADGVTASDFIGNFNGLDQDSSDYYRFELAENSTLNLKLSGLSGNASLILYNSDQSRIVARSSNTGNADEIISLNLKAGTYYAYVSGGSNVSTTYQLEASAISLGPVPTDNAGDTLENARNLGSLNAAAINVTDFIGNFNGLDQDSQDYYRFELTESSTVNLTLSGLIETASLTVYNSDRSRTVAQGTGTGSENKVLTQDLKAGIYYVYVNGGGTGTNYRLTGSANPVTIIDNGPFANATDLGVLGSTAPAINDSLSPSNSADYYKFTLSENSALNVQLSGLSDAASLFLFNSEGNRVLAQSTNSGNVNEVINVNLKVDTYYLQIDGGNTTGTTYQLQASANSLGPVPADGAGNRIEDAKDLGSLTATGITVSDFVGQFNGLDNDSIDYYKFKLDENSTLKLRLSDLSDNGFLFLVNSDGSRSLISSNNAGTADEVIELNLRADTYHIGVQSVGSSPVGTTYKLQASAAFLGPVPVDGAGNSIEDAKDLGSLTATGITVSDFVGQFNGLDNDSIDYYKFKLDENSTLKLRLSDLSDNGFLFLVNSDGSRSLISSNNAGTADEVIELNLRADTYHIGVQSVGNSPVGTTYKLQASATSLGPVPVDGAGNSIEDAKDLGSLTATGITVSDFVGQFNGLDNDSIDYYKFKLDENSTLKLRLSDLSDNGFLFLVNSDGSRSLISSNNAGTADEVIELNLRADTYHIGVQSVGNSPVGTTYKLQASATSLGPVPADIAGEVVEKAKDLGVLNSNPIAFNDFIGNFNGLSNDGTDYYRFKLVENSEVRLNLTGLSQDASLTLFNSDVSRVIASSNNSGSSNEGIIRNLRAGSYFFVINSNSSIGTNYQIQARADSFGVYEDKAGDTLASARDLGVLDNSRTFEDFIGNYFDLIQDSADLYKFEFKKTSTLSLSLNRLTSGANASIRVLDAQGSIVENSSGSTLNTSLLAGVYYFQIASNGNAGTRYAVTATGAPILDLAGNSLGQARDIGNLKGARTFTDFIGDVDRDDFYRFDLLSKSNVNLSTSPATLGTPVNVRLLDRQGNLIEGSNGSNIAQALDAGSYYAQVTGGDSYYDVAFSAVPEAAGPFKIERVTPVEGSNVGQTTLTVKGSQFTSAAQVSIIDANGVEFVADKVSVRSESSLTATFNLVGVAAGAYDVKVVDAAGTATAEDLFNVTTGTPGKLDVFISAPSALRPWSTGEVVVTYRNSGESDITAPLLTLNAEGANFEENGEYSDGTVQFLAINREGDAGVLPPGATGTFTAKFRPNPGAGNIDFTVNSLATGETVDWNAIEDSSRPENIPVETWDVIFQNFTDEVGDLAGQYEKVLAENASRLSELGEYTGDVSKLLSFELQQGNSQAIFERFTEGSFGRGWNNPWDVTASENSEGDVVIANGGSLRFFEQQANGSYRGDEGDTATLTQQGSAYQLREEDGTVIAFLENGKLGSIVDTNENEVVAGYTGNNLTTLTYSNGDVVRFAYNTAGKVREVTDPFGQKTTYTYDAAGERLLSVTDESGTVSYTYETEGAKANAIQSITFPDGTQTLYEYDDQGRVTKESRNGGAETVSYAYDSAGKVTVTDAEGNTAQLFQNADGQVSRTVDALGRTTEFRYDDSGNLTRITAPNNSVSTFNYDSRGNLLSSTDPLGQQVSFTYDSEFNQIQTVRDQRGNSINYSYDDAGNLDGIVYADGSGESYRYNADGEVTTSINRRGQAINYSYDERGLLTKKAFADGTEATFEYDARGNLTQAVDADSSVAYAYDSANRLTKVTYGKMTYGTERFLEFDYDAGGRRSRMVDQDGFTTNYLYDEVGRLEQLTDKDDANVITYSYDEVGRLAREDNGNGTYTTYGYDTAGQLLSIVNYQPDGDINSRYDYAYDELGQRTSMTTLEGTTSYGYDPTGQLTSVELPNGREIVYEYDAAGNRISVTDDGVTTNYTTNNLNQYATVGDAVYTYDTDGNLISKVDGDDTWTYSYDIENRLIGVTTPDGTWAYEYDALGNRIASVEGGDRTDYLVDPSGLGDVVGKYNTEQTSKFTHGVGLVSQNSSGGFRNYYDSNAIGSVVGVSDSTGTYVNSYAYLPFGEIKNKTELVSNPYEYVGRWGVMEEEGALNFMRARFYSVAEGRFANPDPIGVNGGINLYQYSANNPVQLIDPSGLCPDEDYDAFRNAGDAYRKHYDNLEENKKLLDQGGWRNADKVLNNDRRSGNDAFNSARKASAGVPQAAQEYYGDVLLKRPKTPKKGLGFLEDATGPIGSLLCGLYPDLPFCNCGDSSATPPELGGQTQTFGRTLVVNSFDPNDILGPSGFGPLNYITPDQTLPYTIRFENQASATAPAVFVTITQTLDADLDLSTFELGDFGFGDIYIDVPEGFQNYTQRLDLRDTIGDYVDFEASLNKETGEVLWTLTTIDDETGNIPDAVDAGFLPPNNDTNDGEGFVTYRINAKPGLPTGTRLDAEASIVFDTNEAIETPPIFNTLDVGTPSSQVTTFSGTVFPTFDVSWSGTDDGSGIATYDIYVAVDGGDYELWLDNTADTTAIYTGEAGRTYQFYSVAKDNVGYTEDALRIADATTTPVEAIATVVATTFDVTNDHVITGLANVTFTLANRGNTDATDISAAIVYSDDDIIGNEDDLIVETIAIGDLVSGGEIEQSISVQLSRELLNSRAQADDITGLGNEYVSGSYDYLGILINLDSESNAIPDAALQKGISTDDITYFPWDIDGNGLVTPTDAIFVINRLGQSTLNANIRADFDGNGLITPTDAISAINRLGYEINGTVIEVI